MHEQFALLFLTALLIAAGLHAANGQSPALAVAGMPLRNTPFAGLFEKAALLFEKDASEIVKDLKSEWEQGFNKYKGEIKDIVDGYKSANEKGATKDDVDNLQKSLTDKIKEVEDFANDLAVKQNRLKEEGDPKKAKSLMGLAEDGLTNLKSSLKDNAALVDMKGLFKNSPQAGKEVNIDLKAVSNMTTGYALTGTNSNIMRAFDTEPGVAKDPTTPLFITDLISTGVTDAQTIYWVERVLVEGGAGQVAEAAQFPQVSAKYSKFSANAKKTAAYAKITEESVEDVDYILSEIQSEIVSGPNSIRVQVENQILTGDGTGENHLGLFTVAPTFAKPTGFNTLAAPTYYDAAQAGILQIAKANFTPTEMLVNPSDLVNMQLTKDSQGNYVMPPFIGQNGMVIGGVRIVANNRVAEGSYLIGDMKRATLFMKRQLTIKFFDQNENDALYDLRTITGSLRAIFRVKGPDKKAFVKGTFAATMTAIKTV